MYKKYRQLAGSWTVLTVLLSLLLSGSVALAQSGPVGNEWIVPGQQYYKVRVVRDGIYKLDYQYLSNAGISGVAPTRLQMWRRGREIAIYVGGNNSALDPSTFIEFYGQRNDGKLDAELYKQPSDQAHQLYNFYTDTSSYFITWDASATGRPGRRMAEPTVAGGTTHPHRILNQLNLRTEVFYDAPLVQYNYLPWVEPTEGFFSGAITMPTDSVLRNISASGPPPRVEVLVMGASDAAHLTEVQVVPPTGPPRSLGTISFTGLVRARQSFPLLRSDIGSNGLCTVVVKPANPSNTADRISIAYFRLIAPQANRWFPNRNSVAFQNDSLLAGPATYELDSIPATAQGFDVQDPYNVQRVVGTAVSGGFQRRRFVFPSATSSATRFLLLADEARLARPVQPGRQVRFRTINPAVPTFIIITHPKIMGPAGGFANIVKEYATYRASVAGGRHDTLTVTTFQLYDQFSYGDRSWLALRHFARWMVAATPNGPTRNLLLLGKGIVPSEAIIAGSNRNVIYTYTTPRGAGERGIDLVPTSSRAVSDNLLTADYANDNFAATINTGRLTVINPVQVLNYLNKVKAHDALGSEPWRKNILHLVGGYNALETAEFRSYLDENKVRAERPFLGAHVTTEFRITPSNLPVSIDISAQLNAGLSVITYFGHAAPTKFALDFGSPLTVPTYQNTGKYPFLFLNGCAGNATFTQPSTIVEEWLFADRRGALGSLSESGFSFPTQLKVAQDSLYKLLFNDPNWYGKPIPAVHDESVRRLQRSIYFTNNIGIEQLLCTGWQGDPTLALFAPPRPDFIASSATVSVTPVAGQGPVRAISPEFVLNVGVANPEKITYEPVQIQVTRIFPAGSGRPNQVYPIFTERQAWGTDTTYALTLPNTGNVAGTSTFQVVLDPNNRVLEKSETNNTAQIDFSFLQGGLTVISPTEFAIAATNQPRLVVQSNDPLGAQRVYEFEIDTVATFNKAVQRTTVTAGVVAEWQPTLPVVLNQRDSLVWYWRARFQTPGSQEDGSWATSSLRVIPNSPGGWSQSHYTQFKRDTRAGVDINEPTGRWSFVTTRVPIVLRTRGGGTPRSAANFSSVAGAGINIQTAAGLSSVSGCGVLSPNLLVAVYNPASLRPVAMPASFQSCGLAPDNFYYFSASDASSPLDTLDNLNYSAVRQQELDAFLTAVPAGSYVALVSTNRLRYTLLPAALKARLQALTGSQLISSLRDGEPLAVVGQKLTATTGRLLHERGPDRANLTVLPFNQTIELRDTLQRPSNSGRIASTRIGPAKEWLNLYSKVKDITPDGKHQLSVVAIDTLGRETVVLPNVRQWQQPLGALVSATTYPYLRLELALEDTVTRVPPQLIEWLVTSRDLPEGVVRRDLVAAADYDPAKLAQGVVTTGFLEFPVKFQNVSNQSFQAPLSTRVNVRDVSQSSRPVVATALIPSPALAPGATLTVPVRVNMAGKFGTFVTEVVVNPRLQPEQVYSNNELTLAPFSVQDNNVPPTLDVAFDGRHILNGELVSSRPTINIQLSDEDRIRHITDRSVFTVTLTRPGSTPALVDLNNVAEVEFSVDVTKGSVATLKYEPGKNAPLADGIYTLRVQGRDPGNASAGTQELEVKFEVVNASKITNVYPYPNPIVNKARFVFTVTGQALPTNMKIQIMSLTGRVVREIFMSELGPLHIGNNITDFAWDGTDTFGDRLANGTYLYRVSLDDPNGQFGRRDTAGDKAFKNDWGKLVLMR